MSIFGRTPPAAPPAPLAKRRKGFFDRLLGRTDPEPEIRRGAALKALAARVQNLDGYKARNLDGRAMDSADCPTIQSGIKEKFRLQADSIPTSQVEWFSTLGFIGHQMCALLGQQWLISKACWMPGKDAVRNGYEITATDGQEVSTEALDMLRRMDDRLKVKESMEQFIGLGRMFGVRHAIMYVESADPEYYLKPFNLDGVTPGSYKGISQVDPTWITPELGTAAMNDPLSLQFFEPEYWRVGQRLIHHSHIFIFRTEDVPDLLKPTYLYGGVPLPQKLAERVYAAERTANEAPLLALSKRSTTYKTDVETAMTSDTFHQKMQEWADYRDNWGIRFVSHEDEVQIDDTALADLDALIMTQYQLVASIAEVPATKLLGTSPKGFNSAGTYESKSYHEMLGTTQANDLTPLLQRHHAMCIRSEVAPRLGVAPFRTTISWRPTDMPTTAEWAEINLKKAQTDAALVDAGSIDGMDVRKRLQNDPDSGYFAIEDAEPELPPLETGTVIETEPAEPGTWRAN